MELTVIMVNYKCDKHKLNSCLKSIDVQTKVLIIDHSNDLKKDQIIIPKNIFLKILKNENLGNGAGINYGIKHAETKYVLYLDIDTILPKNFFSDLKKNVSQINDFAIIAPKINDFYNDKKIRSFGNLSVLKFYYNKLFFKIKKENDISKNIKQVFFVSGSIMLINKEIIVNNNVKFDEKIFLFFEEDDFFHQCFKLKLKIFLIDDLQATHLDGSIKDDSLNYECFKKWHWEWSKYYFLNKHYNKLLILIIALNNFLKFLIKISIFYLFNKKKFKIYKSRINGLMSYYFGKNCNIKY